MFRPRTPVEIEPELLQPHKPAADASLEQLLTLAGILRLTGPAPRASMFDDDDDETDAPSAESVAEEFAEVARD